MTAEEQETQTAATESDVSASPSTNGSGPAPEESNAPEVDVEALEAMIESLRAERDEQADNRIRAQADFENIRRRLQKEKEDIVRYAPSDTIRDLLPVLDDFESALRTEGVSDEFKKGLELIHRRIFEVFRRAGLKEVEQHDSFDPNLHYAVDRAPAGEDQKDNQILVVYQKGYKFKDRLLRASMVKVAVKE